MKILNLLIFFIGGVISPLVVSSVSTLIIGTIAVSIGIVSGFLSLLLPKIFLFPLIALIIFCLSWRFHYRLFYRNINSLHDWANRKIENITNINHIKKIGFINFWWFLSFLSMPLIFTSYVLASLSPSPRIKEKARSAAAANTLATMVKECFVKIADKGSGTVIIPELQGYKPKKNNIAGFYLGNDRKLSGTSIDCPTTGEMKVVSEDESEYPTFSYNFGTGKKTCFVESGSDAEKRGCINGEW